MKAQRDSPFQTTGLVAPPAYSPPYQGPKHPTVLRVTNDPVTIYGQWGPVQEVIEPPVAPFVLYKPAPIILDYIPGISRKSINNQPLRRDVQTDVGGWTSIPLEPDEVGNVKLAPLTWPIPQATRIWDCHTIVYLQTAIHCIECPSFSSRTGLDPDFYPFADNPSDDNPIYILKTPAHGLFPIKWGVEMRARGLGCFTPNKIRYAGWGWVDVGVTKMRDETLAKYNEAWIRLQMPDVNMPETLERNSKMSLWEAAHVALLLSATGIANMHMC